MYTFKNTIKVSIKILNLRLERQKLKIRKSIYIADPSSMQDACDINFVIDLAHRGVSVAQWLEPIPHGHSEFFLYSTLVTRRKTSFSMICHVHDNGSRH